MHGWGGPFLGFARNDRAGSRGVRDYAWQRGNSQLSAAKHGGAILGIIIVLMLAPGILLSAWLIFTLMAADPPYSQLGYASGNGGDCNGGKLRRKISTNSNT